jgi:hypothetical protein
MQEVHFVNLLIVTAVAFAAPLALGFAPALRLLAVVFEIRLAGRARLHPDPARRARPATSMPPHA